jgi:hypothetical protein
MAAQQAVQGPMALRAVGLRREERQELLVGLAIYSLAELLALVGMVEEQRAEAQR